jgi:hypothetical protein
LWFLQYRGFPIGVRIIGSSRNGRAKLQLRPQSKPRVFLNPPTGRFSYSQFKKRNFSCAGRQWNPRPRRALRSRSGLGWSGRSWSAHGWNANIGMDGTRESAFKERCNSAAAASKGGPVAFITSIQLNAKAFRPQPARRAATCVRPPQCVCSPPSQPGLGLIQPGLGLALSVLTGDRSILGYGEI